MSANSVFDFSVSGIDGAAVDLAQYRGKALLIVNTASQCGFTPQFEGLEALWREWQAQGLVVLGFPCDQFGGQEPGSNAQVQSFCTSRYGVSFPMMAKVDVNGPQAVGLYRWLVRQKRGWLGSARIKWNFTKFLLNPQGEVIGRYAPFIKPEKLQTDIAAVLR